MFRQPFVSIPIQSLSVDFFLYVFSEVDIWHAKQTIKLCQISSGPLQAKLSAHEMDKSTSLEANPCVHLLE
jgi:hypothetical protein